MRAIFEESLIKFREKSKKNCESFWENRTDVNFFYWGQIIYDPSSKESIYVGEYDDYYKVNPEYKDVKVDFIQCMDTLKDEVPLTRIFQKYLIGKEYENIHTLYVLRSNEDKLSNLISNKNILEEDCPFSNNDGISYNQFKQIFIEPTYLHKKEKDISFAFNSHFELLGKYKNNKNLDIAILFIPFCYNYYEKEILYINTCVCEFDKIDYVKDFYKEFEPCTFYLLKDHIRHFSNEIRKESIKSAIAAIMSRNMSHNLGSHVISGTKSYLTNQNYNITKGDNKGIYRLLQYLQERMDFIAVICNSVHNHYTFNAPLNLKADILDEFAADGRDERHPSQMQKLEYTKSFLLDYIVRSEKVYRNNQIDGDKGLEIVLFRKQKDSDKYFTFTSQKNGDNNSRDFNDINFSVPLGINSRHAFLTILENFIRNSAKHNHEYPNNTDKLLISILIEENNETYTVKIFDNKENQSDYLKYNENREYVTVEKEEYYNTKEEDRLLKLQNDLNSIKILSTNGVMDTGHKGLKEMLICSAWLQNKNDNWNIIENNRENNLITYYIQDLKDIHNNLIITQDVIQGKTEEVLKLLDQKVSSLGIQFTLPKHRYVYYCESIEFNKNYTDKILFEKIEKLCSADFYIVKIPPQMDSKQKEYKNKIRYALPRVVFISDDIQKIGKKDIVLVDNSKNNSEDVLLWCYQQMNLDQQVMLISYKDHPKSSNPQKKCPDFKENIIIRKDGTEENDFCIDTNKKIRLFINHNDGKDVFVSNYNTCKAHYQNKLLFLEGISGASFNYNLLINAGISEVDYHKIIQSCDTKIAIIDERIFDKYKNREFNNKGFADIVGALKEEQIELVKNDINAYRNGQIRIGGFAKTSEIIYKYINIHIEDVKEIKKWIDEKPEEVDNFIRNLEKEQLTTNYSKIWLEKKNIFIYNIKLTDFEVSDKAIVIDFEDKEVLFSHSNIDYISIHYSIISKYANAKKLSFKDAFRDFLKDIGIDDYYNSNTRITIHSGRGGVAEIQKDLPFLPVSMIDSQLEDCKYKLAQLFLNMKYK